MNGFPRDCWYKWTEQWHEGRCFGFASESIGSTHVVQAVAIVESKIGSVFTVAAEDVRFMFTEEITDAK